MTDSPRHSVSVSAAIFDDSGENVLLIKRRDNGNWEPPGGVLELDEPIHEGLRREVREETGAEIEVGPLTGVYKNLTRGIVALVFRCNHISQPNQESPEASAVAWMPAATVSDLMPDAYAVRINDAQGSHHPHIRTHDGVAVLSDDAR